jgi:hypothetical protein
MEDTRKDAEENEKGQGAGVTGGAGNRARAAACCAHHGKMPWPLLAGGLPLPLGWRERWPPKRKVGTASCRGAGNRVRGIKRGLAGLPCRDACRRLLRAPRQDAVATLGGRPSLAPLPERKVATEKKNRGRNEDRTHPSLRTGRADLPHPALRLVFYSLTEARAARWAACRLNSPSSAKWRLGQRWWSLPRPRPRFRCRFR